MPGNGTLPSQTWLSSRYRYEQEAYRLGFFTKLFISIKITLQHLTHKDLKVLIKVRGEGGGGDGRNVFLDLIDKISP